MKYMTFTASCSYCCVANMMEKHGLHKEDREIVCEAGIPYLFAYDEESGTYKAGAG